MVGNWQGSFGTGGPVRPASPSYEQIYLTANTALVWPLESSPGTPSMAGLLAVTPSQAGFSLALPDATQGATGIISIISNPGSAAFTLTDTFGAQVGVINAGEAWVLSLTDNGMPAGAWNLIQLGALTSNAQAGALAGYGLEAVGATLNVAIQTFTFSANQLISTPQTAAGVIWGGVGDGTFQLDAITTVGDEWWTLVSNQSTGFLTISTSGSDTINGVAELVLPPGGSGQPYSCLIVASSTGFNTFAGTPPIIPISGGGTGATTSAQALINLGGSTIGIEIFEATDAAAILALLGIGPSSFTELTVSTDQNVNPSSINTAYVCTAASLNLNLPLTTDLTNQFVIVVYSQGGTVSLNPQPTDKLNNGGAGIALVMPQGSSMLLTTDGNGNWWPFFYVSSGGGSSAAIPWCVSTGTGDAIVATYSPAITALTDGFLVNFRAVAANASTSPTFNPNALGAQPIKKYGNVILTPGDIPNVGAEVQLRWNAGGNWWELLAPLVNLDIIGATQGDVLFRGASLWTALPPGGVGATSRQSLKTGGTGQNPFWDWTQPGAQQTIASASSTDVGTLLYNNVIITGTTNINDFGASADIAQPIYFLEFSGVLALVSGGALVLPGGANITTAAGDTAIAQYLGSGNWKIRQYTILATGEGGGAPPIPPGGTQAVQGLYFSAVGGSYAQIYAFGGVSATRTGSGTFSVTLGGTPLTIGYFQAQAVEDGSGDIVGCGDPQVDLVAGGTYTFTFRYGSSKTLIDPHRCLILFY